MQLFINDVTLNLFVIVILIIIVINQTKFSKKFKESKTLSFTQTKSTKQVVDKIKFEIIIFWLKMGNIFSRMTINIHVHFDNERQRLRNDDEKKDEIKYESEDDHVGNHNQIQLNDDDDATLATSTATTTTTTTTTGTQTSPRLIVMQYVQQRHFIIPRREESEEKRHLLDDNKELDKNNGLSPGKYLDELMDDIDLEEDNNDLSLIHEVDINKEEAINNGDNINYNEDVDESDSTPYHSFHSSLFNEEERENKNVEENKMNGTEQIKQEQDKLEKYKLIQQQLDGNAVSDILENNKKEENVQEKSVLINMEQDKLEKAEKILNDTYKSSIIARIMDEATKSHRGHYIVELGGDEYKEYEEEEKDWIELHRIIDTFDTKALQQNRYNNLVKMNEQKERVKEALAIKKVESYEETMALLTKLRVIKYVKGELDNMQKREILKDLEQFQDEGESSNGDSNNQIELNDENEIDEGKEDKKLEEPDDKLNGDDDVSSGDDIPDITYSRYKIWSRKDERRSYRSYRNFNQVGVPQFFFEYQRRDQLGNKEWMKKFKAMIPAAIGETLDEYQDLQELQEYLTFTYIDLMKYVLFRLRKMMEYYISHKVRMENFKSGSFKNGNYTELDNQRQIDMMLEYEEDVRYDLIYKNYVQGKVSYKVMLIMSSLYSQNDEELDYKRYNKVLLNEIFKVMLGTQFSFHTFKNERLNELRAEIFGEAIKGLKPPEPYQGNQDLQSLRNKNILELDMFWNNNFNEQLLIFHDDLVQDIYFNRFKQTFLAENESLFNGLFYLLLDQSDYFNDLFNSILLELYQFDIDKRLEYKIDNFQVSRSQREYKPDLLDNYDYAEDEKTNTTPSAQGYYQENDNKLRKLIQRTNNYYNCRNNDVNNDYIKSISESFHCTPIIAGSRKNIKLEQKMDKIPTKGNQEEKVLDEMECEMDKEDEMDLREIKIPSLSQKEWVKLVKLLVMNRNDIESELKKLDQNELAELLILITIFIGNPHETRHYGSKQEILTKYVEYQELVDKLNHLEDVLSVAQSNIHQLRKGGDFHKEIVYDKISSLKSKFRAICDNQNQHIHQMESKMALIDCEHIGEQIKALNRSLSLMEQAQIRGFDELNQVKGELNGLRAKIQFLYFLYQRNERKLNQKLEQYMKRINDSLHFGSKLEQKEEKIGDSKGRDNKNSLNLIGDLNGRDNGNDLDLCIKSELNVKLNTNKMDEQTKDNYEPVISSTINTYKNKEERVETESLLDYNENDSEREEKIGLNERFNNKTEQKIGNDHVTHYDHDDQVLQYVIQESLAAINTDKVVNDQVNEQEMIENEMVGHDGDQLNINKAGNKEEIGDDINRFSDESEQFNKENKSIN